ncbi:hypothetical protein [Promicromonospora sp. AC04]|uniref:hypothetical protein n=1 Tax=Promicromonospora sp. AC04 TaxID=2135723 RepID=UPI0011B2831F|nr:hypothetical protein [Promicromonospora sp. AC04]
MDDQRAITAHLKADASSGHRFLAQQIWHTAQALGVPTSSHVLATGLDAAVLVGTTAPEEHGRATSLWDAAATWRAMTPPRWPYPAFTVDPAPEPAGARARGLFAVQIVSQVGLDVRARSMTAWSNQQRLFHEDLAGALTSAAPDGLVVALASHTILDTPRRDRWEEAGEVADFLGAARLPSHALRTDARCDAPFDLLIFRRHGHHAVVHAPGQGPELVVPGTVLMQSGEIPVSEYYRSHRGHVLGLPMVRTDRWDMDHLTVLDTEQTWLTRLPQVLDQITRAHTPPALPGTTASVDAQRAPRAASRVIPRTGVEADRSSRAADSVPPL